MKTSRSNGRPWTGEANALSERFQIAASGEATVLAGLQSEKYQSEILHSSVHMLSNNYVHRANSGQIQ